MSNTLFAKFRKASLSYTDAGLSAPVDLKTDTIKAALVSAAYTPSLANDQFYSTIAAAVLGTPQALTWTSDTAGQYKASNPSFSGITSAVATYVAIYKDTGTAGTSPLIALYDTATGLPFTAGGSPVTIAVTFDPTNGLFTI